MKAAILCLFLLSACSDEIAYDYALTWTCRTAEGCERAESLMLLNRMNISGDTFIFLSTHDDWDILFAQKFGSEPLPEGCFWLYSLVLFGHELEPAKTCEASGGLDLELSIPNRDPSTHSLWLVKARDAGAL